MTSSVPIRPEMSPAILFHILAGSAALGSGAVALVARKGHGVHLAAGRVFAVSMMAMSLSGVALALCVADAESVMGGWLTFHLVATGSLALREHGLPRGWLAVLAWVGIAVAAAAFVSLAAARISPADRTSVAVFGGLLGSTALADLFRHFRGPLAGRRRLLRHLWRMQAAMLLACVAFFLGQADEFPPWVQRTGVLMLPGAAVAITLLYWILRTAWWRRTAR